VLEKGNIELSLSFFNMAWMQGLKTSTA